jgi:hypothetical protein
VSAAAVAPSITAQPASQTVTAGQTASFAVVAAGTAPLSYQWQKNGANIAGASSASYTTAATTTSDSGSTFHAVVTNTAGTVTSAAATLTVNPAPAPGIQVSSTSLNFGNAVLGSTLSQVLIITNTGTATLSITQVTETGSAFFTVSGFSLPLNVNAGQQTTITAAYLPTSVGTVSGNISIVSNAPGSPLAISLSGTGVAATFLLGANPTSLSFGNVNVGSNSSLGATLTNNGNSNVTISSVTVTGAAFSTNGVTPGTVLTPNQSVALNTVFAPTTAGSVIGTVSVLSNATNSPATIALSGSAVTQTGGPLCGQLNDGLIHIPPNWDTFTPPALGQSYVDPVFGCTVKRLTNGSLEALGDGTHPGLMDFYSTLTALNASDTMFFAVATDGNWSIRDTNGNIVVATVNMPNFSGHPVWDASNGNVFYYAFNNGVYSGTISGSSVNGSALHTFSEYSAVTSMDMADLSQDGDHMALIGQNANSTMDVFVWSLSQKTKTSVYTTACTGSVAGAGQPGCLHKLQLTPNNLLTIQFAPEGSGAEQGVRLWTGTSLVHMQNVNTNHYDTGSDLNGNPVFLAVNNSVTLPSITSPCASGWGLDVRQLNNLQSAICLLDNQPYWHISYRGGASQPWIAISFFDSRTPGPEFFSSDGNYQAISTGNWQLYEDEIVLPKVDGSKVYRLAHARSRSMESYWAQPHAAISRDGKYVIFSSNMAHPNGCPANMHVANDCSDVYMIKVQ